jgi:hypothetical protein
LKPRNGEKRVSQDRRQTDPHHPPGLGAEQRLRRRHRHVALQHVEGEDDQAGPGPEHAQGVGGPDVARAVLAQVHALEQLAGEEAERDRAEQERPDQQERQRRRGGGGGDRHQGVASPWNSRRNTARTASVRAR